MADSDRPDLLVIGAGPAGFAAAMEAARLGAVVLVVERGGTSAINVSLPASALAAAAARAQAMRTATPFGIVGEEPRINYRRVHEHVAEVVGAVAPDHAPERLAALGVEVIRGEARFTDKATVLVGERAIRARRVVVATGSRPVTPSIPGLADIPYFTAETIVHNSRKLSHLLVIGGGKSALELAQSHRRLGSEVTLVDPAVLLPAHDPDLVEIALRRLREEGMALLDRTAVTAIRPRSQGIGVAVQSGEGEERTLDVSHVLVVATRQPELAPLDPHRAALLRDRDGNLLLSRGVLTRNRRVYAIGDAAVGGTERHVAAAQGRAVARHALLGAPLPGPALAGPSVVHIDPEIAEIGLPEAEALKLPGARVLRIALAETDRARVERTGYGLIKVVVDASGHIHSAGIVGQGAAETIALFALAMAGRLRLADLAAFVPAYPTLAEAVHRLAAEAGQGATPSPADLRRIALVRRLP